MTRISIITLICIPALHLRLGLLSEHTAAGIVLASLAILTIAAHRAVHRRTVRVEITRRWG